MREGWRVSSLDSDFAFEIAGLQGGNGGVSNIIWGIRMQDHDLTGDRHSISLRYSRRQICVCVSVSSLHSLGSYGSDALWLGFILNMEIFYRIISSTDCAIRASFLLLLFTKNVCMQGGRIPVPMPTYRSPFFVSSGRSLQRNLGKRRTCR
jgi:hypothetical protein